MKKVSIEIEAKYIDWESLLSGVKKQVNEDCREIKALEINYSSDNEEED